MTEFYFKLKVIDELIGYGILALIIIGYLIYILCKSRSNRK